MVIMGERMLCCVSVLLCKFSIVLATLLSLIYARFHNIRGKKYKEWNNREKKNKRTVDLKGKVNEFCKLVWKTKEL